MNNENYLLLLQSLDWDYEKSDDPRHVAEHKDLRDRIDRMRDEDNELRRIYCDFTNTEFIPIERGPVREGADTEGLVDWLHNLGRAYLQPWLQDALQRHGITSPDTARIKWILAVDKSLCALYDGQEILRVRASTEGESIVIKTYEAIRRKS